MTFNYLTVFMFFCLLNKRVREANLQKKSLFYDVSLLLSPTSNSLAVISLIFISIIYEQLNN